ncbi:hypothetical protein ACLOJK_008934 [Asimina triloba]
MGLSASTRVSAILRNSSEFDAACDAAYDECLDLAQHAFSGLRPYQLLPASSRLHAAASAAIPLVKRWAPSPPTQLQVDRALRSVVGADETLTRAQFKEFAVEVLKEEIVSNARGTVLRGIPVGLVGIAGVGMATRAGRDATGRAIGAYALGISAAVYISLCF